MKLPFTRKILQEWAGDRVFREGAALFEAQAVRRVAFEHPTVSGELSYGNRSISSGFRLHADGSAETLCPCRDGSERAIICSHVIALALELLRQSADPERQRLAEQERRRAERLAAVDESQYIRRVAPGKPGAVPAELRIHLGAEWEKALRYDRVPIEATLRCGDRELPLEAVPLQTTFALSDKDEALLFVLEDIAGGPARSRCELAVSDFINLLELLPGRALHAGGRRLPVHSQRMRSSLRMDMDPANGELILMVHTELPAMDAQSLPVYIVSGKRGWVHDAGQFWPLESLLPLPLQGIYRQPIVVERKSVLRFVQTELPLLARHIAVKTDISAELFTLTPMKPSFRLHVRGSPASVAATLLAQYGDLELVVGRPDANGHFALPDPDDLLGYKVRNPIEETRALLHLHDIGFTGDRGDTLSNIIGTREVLNFLGSGLPRLRRLGWKISMEGKVGPFMEELDFATPVVHIHTPPGGGADWFEVGFDFEDGRGASLSEAEIQRALLKGDSYVERAGRTILLDSNAIQTARDVFRDCASGEGSRAGAFRLSGIHSAYVQSSLEALDGIDVETAPEWTDRARRQNRGQELQPVPLPPPLEDTLRPYQKDGVYWLRFLENNQFGGILADEMGLGKTLQTLAWIGLERALPQARNHPVLIVCPTSLVENWSEEAQRFTPQLRRLLISGTDRHDKWERLGEADLVITSYALMRRDVDRYLQHEFSAVILDEAQHIKNHSTQNALAAKRLRAPHKLVLTGTPIENSVSDLWSIMDFLMPGYLGNHQSFREGYELPIGRGGPDAEFAQARLRRKLQPFLLRRLKKEVAKELPPKIIRTAHCTMTRDQQAVYKQLLEASQRKIQFMVEQKGFNRSRMEILKTLLRLRQVCCHLDLLKLDGLRSEYPSAKMDLFFELLDEALDGGHRVLVFSQFTTMLGILRREVERRGLRYCYLDGSTKDRMGIVRQFNGDRDIPLFLMSLKAGGTGLNLTGADMVVHFDPWWNPAVEDQATDRAYRIGQKRTVYSIKLITRGTVEEKVLEMQKRKQAVIDAALSKDEEAAAKLTWNDVQELLGL